MNKFLKRLGLVLLVVCAPVLAVAYTVPNDVPPGFRLIDGTVINDILNALRINKISRGTSTFTGVSSAITTGLDVITSCTANVVTSAVPNKSVVTYTKSGGTLTLYGWKATAAGTTTLTTATGSDIVAYTCIGQ